MNIQSLVLGFRSQINQSCIDRDVSTAILPNRRFTCYALTATNFDSPTMISFKSALSNTSQSFALLLSAEFILPSL